MGKLFNPRNLIGTSLKAQEIFKQALPQLPRIGPLLIGKAANFLILFKCALGSPTAPRLDVECRYLRPTSIDQWSISRAGKKYLPTYSSESLEWLSLSFHIMFLTIFLYVLLPIKHART